MAMASVASVLHLSPVASLELQSSSASRDVLKTSSFGAPINGLRAARGAVLVRKGCSHVCRAQAKPTAKGRGGSGGQALPKKPRKIEKLDVSKAAGVEAFQVFARLEKDKEDVNRFKPIAEILVETGGDVAKALKERRRQLVELARGIIEFANCPETGLQYGFQKSPSKGERHDLNPTVIAIGGPLDDDSVPAILRSADTSGLRLYSAKDGSYTPQPIPALKS
ncbi:hypothetical protein KFL_000790450 [Klebsormidium nitens]|uniref:Uncharacterized protein n=1 Tax=Klebsormidium nitens TaxID=105231 RepID=A0A1Y1HS16_KLENI|nr:hypothetical protein KFL_000790450 [Klebsormidium nitens]|eukprot:GAQ81420.1 hypothetical protein KFL_000790450 [Klebsormidium nitens]